MELAEKTSIDCSEKLGELRQKICVQSDKGKTAMVVLDSW